MAAGGQLRAGAQRDGGGARGEGGLPSPALPHLPRNQVLEAAQLVLVLGVVPGVLLSEEGLGRTDRWSLVYSSVQKAWGFLFSFGMDPITHFSGTGRRFCWRRAAVRSCVLDGAGTRRDPHCFLFLEAQISAH